MIPLVLVKGVAGKFCTLCGYRLRSGVTIKQTPEKKWAHETCLELVSDNKFPARTVTRAKLHIVKPEATNV